MSTTWDSDETRDLVMALYGKRQWFDLAWPSVRSFKDRALFAEYHYHEAKDLLTPYIEKVSHAPTMLQLHADQDHYDEFSDMMMCIRAHFTAAIQSLHAMADTAAHMLHYALALDREPKAPKPRGITAKSVLALMEGKADLDNLRGLLSSMCSGPGFARLDGLSNMAKHRSIVRPSLNEDWTGKRAEKYMLPFEDFTYEGQDFASVDVREFVRQEHDRMQHLMVDIGVELNAVLTKRKGP